MDMQTVKELLSILNEMYPVSLSEAWDSSGLQVGSLSWPADRILIALEPSIDTIHEAIEANANVLITHHPLAVTGIYGIDIDTYPGSVVAKALKENIAIISIHTQADAAVGGLNDFILQQLGAFNQIAPLSPSETEKGGLGRIAFFVTPISVEEFKKTISSVFMYDINRFSLPKETIRLSSIAICAGSGSDQIPAFLKTVADVFITGDVKYHIAQELLYKKRGIIDVGHFGSEIFFLPMLFQHLTEKFSKEKQDIAIFVTKNEKSPFSSNEL